MKAKVNFLYSYIYDVFCQEHYNWKQIETDSCKKFIKEFEPFWRSNEKAILKELEKITGKNWIRFELNSYIVTYCQPFSDPISLPLYWHETGKIVSDQAFFDTLIHELGHHLFAQHKEFEEWMYEVLSKDFPNENIQTIVHIPLFTILTPLYLNLFSENDLERITKKYDEIPLYKKAWEIVNEKGHKYFLKKLFG